MKKLIVVMVCAGLLVGGCGSTNGGSSSHTKTAKENSILAEVMSGVDALKEHPDYMISSLVDDASGTLYNLDIVHNGEQYTEYSYDTESEEIGTLDYGSSSQMKYVLNEYITSDNKVYAFANDSVYSLPDGYYDYVGGRSSLYVDDMMSSAYDIRKEDSFELDVTGVEEKFQGYSFKIPAEVAKKIYGASSYGVYTSLKEEHKDDNIGKLCDFYLEGINFELTCSDANVFVGLDIDGVLRYMCLEIGGGGTRSYLTKIVLGFENDNVRETPDFTDAKDFSVTLSDLADFVSSYDTYDEALDALSEMEGNLSSGDTVVDEVTEASEIPESTEEPQEEANTGVDTEEGEISE